MPSNEQPSTPKPKIITAAQQAKLKSTKVTDVGKTQLEDFVNFLRTQGVVGLAVGLVLGGAVSVLVKSLIDNVVMPPLGLLLGSTEGLKGLGWAVGKTAAGKVVIVHYGIFLNDFINFIVIALVIYFIIHLMGFDRIDKKKD